MNAQVLHLGSDGRLTPADAQLAANVRSMFEMAKLEHGGMRALQQRMDAAYYDNQIANNPMNRERADRCDGIHVGERADAFGEANGLHIAKDLEYVHARALEEKTQPLNFFKFFRTGDGIPAGARTHTVRRFFTQGEAKFYAGAGSNVPTVSLTQAEEEFPVRHIVTSFETNVFEMMSSGYAGVQEEQRKVRGARKIMDRFLNTVGWNGDAAANYYGVLSYPYLAKKSAATPFDGTAASADDVLAELNAGANYAMEESGGTMMPNRCLTSIRVRNYLMQTQRSTASDKTIGQLFIEQNETINAIESARELRDVGGTGIDGILFYNDDKDSVCHETAGGVQMLPAQAHQFSSVRFMYMSSGGIVMRDAGNNLLLLVTAN